jgi:endonuclease YncB( thermonuclease family)
MMSLMNRRGRVALLSGLGLIGLAATGIIANREPPPIVGPARVIDGDSIVVAGVEIRLYGIDAPEFRQTCMRAGHPWACGITATRFLQSLLAGRELSCRPREQDRYGRTIAICFAGGADVGAVMVKAGQAVAYGAYQADERDARTARRGVWASSFEHPAVWRARHPRPTRG